MQAGAGELVVEESNGVVVATVNRPAQANALDRVVVDGLHAVLDQIERTPRFLVITGADARFVGGSDLGFLANRRLHDGLTGPVVALFDRLERAPLPTIAAIDGPAIGGGAELAYACDIRIVTPRARFGQPEVRLGLTAGAGATWRLPALIGKSLALQMVLAGRQIDGAAAVACGLAMEMVEPPDLLGRSREVAAQMAMASPEALRVAKISLHASPAAHPAVDLIAQAMLLEQDSTRHRLEKALHRSKSGDRGGSLG
jgi:enoyl-CoA hydratase/carnithine racemase